jgi:hypothetical protein
VITEEDLNHIDFPRVPGNIEQRGLEYYLDNDMKERMASPEKKIRKALPIVNQEEEKSIQNNGSEEE